MNFGFVNSSAHRTWVIYGYRPGNPVMPHPEVDCPDFILRAARAVPTNGVWTFYDAREYARTTYVLLLETNVLAMPEFDETPDEIQNDYKIASYLKIGGQNPNIPLKDICIYLQWHPQMPRRGPEPAPHGIEPAHCHAADLPGGGAHRHSLWRGARAAEFILRRGRQHFYLFPLFRAAAGEPGVWLQRRMAGLARGLAAQFSFQRARAGPDHAHPVKINHAYGLMAHASR